MQLCSASVSLRSVILLQLCSAAGRKFSSWLPPRHCFANAELVHASVAATPANCDTHGGSCLPPVTSPLYRPAQLMPCFSPCSAAKSFAQADKGLSAAHGANHEANPS